MLKELCDVRQLARTLRKGRARLWRVASFAQLGALVSAFGSLVAAGHLHALAWPVANSQPKSLDQFSTFVQPTESGRLKSGLFGSTRNDGRRFHEGIDIRATTRDAQGRPLDLIQSISEGTVVHVNREESKSSYGKYVVIEHRTKTIPLYSLYAHIEAIRQDMNVGMRVQEGEVFAKMGTTAGGYNIPNERGHLHFEIGVRLSNHFQKWYDEQDFDSKNAHGNWSGINLVGLNPLLFYQTMGKDSGDATFMSVVDNGLATDFTISVHTTIVPEFVRHYPMLMTRELKDEKLSKWRIEYTWYGFPKKWTPIYDHPKARKRWPAPVGLNPNFDPKPLFSQQGRIMWKRPYGEGGGVLPGKHLIQNLDILFGTHANEKE